MHEEDSLNTLGGLVLHQLQELCADPQKTARFLVLLIKAMLS